MRLSAWRIVLAAALVSVPAAASFSVSPQSVVTDVVAGGRKRVEITVVNETPTPRALRYFPAPFRQKPDGSYEIVAVADPARSCHGWFLLDTVTTILGAGEGRLIRIDIDIPRNARGTYFGAVVFDLMPSDSVSTGDPTAAVGLVMRMPAFFELTAGARQLRSRVELLDLTVLTPAELGGIYARRLSPDALGVKARIRNAGPIRFEVGGHAVLRDSLGRRVKSFPLGSGTVLPGAEVELRSVLAPLRRGRYSLDVAVRAGSGSPAKGSVVFHAGRKTRLATTAVTVPQLDISVTPEQLEMTLPQRAVRTRSVTVRNESDQPVRLRASLRGLQGFVDGTVDQTEVTGKARDCRNWTRVEPAELTLAARATQNIRLTFEPPVAATGGQFGSLYIEQAGGKVQGREAPSFVVPLLLTVEGNYRRSIEIAGVAGSPESGLVVRLVNTGDVHLTPTTRAAIKRALQPNPMGEGDYQPVGTVELDSGIVLPGDTITVTGKYQGSLAEGEYKMDIVVDCGKGLSRSTTGQFKVGKR